jgi:hypothetical protein
MYGWGIRQNYGTFASKFTYICIYDNLYIHTLLCDIHLNDEKLSNLNLLIYDEELCNLFLLIYDEELCSLFLLIYDEELSNLFLLICDEEISNLYLFIYFILGTTIKDDTKVDLAIIIGASVGGFVALLIIIIIICCHCLRTR